MSDATGATGATSTIDAIVAAAHGGPEVLRPGTLEPREPGPGEVRIRQRFAGVNFIDVYHRTGHYPCPLPLTPGVEASGEVVALGEGVAGLAVGQRVAYVAAQPGAYATERVIAATRVVALPDEVSLEAAATLMVRGLTAEYLLHRTFELRPGSAVLIHAAAGGMGLMLGRWARALGAEVVVGTVSSPAKAELARAHGYTDVLLYRDVAAQDLAAQVRGLTAGGAGVDVVYDGVGAATLESSLSSLRPRGMLVSFGQSSGAPPPFDLAELGRRGSLFLTRPSLFHYVAQRDELERAAARLFAALRAGHVEALVGQRYPLARAADAHRDLEARRTVGATVLELG